MTNTDHKINSIVIVGGGTAGWMTAAALSHVFKKENYSITLVESDQIGTVGVGEATIPVLHKFNQMMGIDENDFLSKTQGTFKLGIQFVNWGSIGNSYIHPFGAYGMPIGFLSFYHYWLRYHKQQGAEDPGDFSICIQAALRGKFMPPAKLPNSPLSQITYAYHFDASLYAKYLRDMAEAKGVTRKEGEVVQVVQDSNSGFINSIKLKDGSSIEGDLFIDCSGFTALLIEKTLNTGYEDYNYVLPCDRAVTVATKNTQAPVPYTKSTAHSAGWQWKIPLQHRTGNGHVYCSKYMSDDEAASILIKNTDGELLSEPRLVRFKTGMRRKFWNKNCVAIGLSSGFLEPLESTSIHLIQSSISKLIALFPSKAFESTDIDKYNELLTSEFLFIRDFIVLHYKVSQRTDSDFWNYCRNMEVSESLQKKINLYTAGGRLFRDNNELFDEVSWFAVMHGQGLRVSQYHPLVDEIEDVEFNKMMHEIRSVIGKSADVMPAHIEYIQKKCKALGGV